MATTIDRVGLDGTVTEVVTIPDDAGFNLGSQLTTGPDGNLWLSLPDNDTLTRITLAGAVTSFKIPESPYGLVTGPDNNLWFTGTTIPTGGWNPLNEGLQGTPLIGRYSLPSDANPNGAVTEFTAGISGIPGPMIAGPDGNLWFTEAAVHILMPQIGRVTPSGIITEFPIGSSPFPGGLDITAGPDGNVWFTDESANSVGRITPAGAP
jgi:streptogramin lyase